MKLVTYELAGAVGLGRIDPQAGMIYRLSASEAAFGNDMVALIRRHARLDSPLESEATGVALEKVKLLAPIPRPARNIFCVGKNYYEHAQEFTQSSFGATSKRGDNIPDNPIIFTKAPSTVTAPGDAVPCHGSLSAQLDYEAELAAIIEARMEEVFSLVLRELHRYPRTQSLGAGVVLTGGGCLIEGAAELAEQVLKMPVRVGVPTGCFSGLEDRLMDPAFSTAMGLVLMGVEELTGSARYDDLANPRYEDVAGRMKGWIEALF